MATFEWFGFELGIMRVEYIRCGCVLAHLTTLEGNDVQMLSTVECANRIGSDDPDALPDEAFSLSDMLTAMLVEAAVGRGQ